MAEPFQVRPPNRGFIGVSGPDAESFLQGIITVDVKSIGPEHVAYGAMLTPQGRILWDFFAARIGETIVLECEGDRLGAFLKRLSMYRLRSKVDLGDISDDFAAIAFAGERAVSALDLDAAPGSARPWHGGVLFTDPRLAGLGARAIVDVGQLDAALAETGIAAGDAEAYDRLRLSLGVPDGARDLVDEKALPLESGLDELNAISWTKGCYMGQELTARMNYRALVKKRLLPVEIDGPAPEAGSAIELDGKVVGDMRSSNGHVGLAYLRLEALAADAPLVCGDARLTPRPPQWLKLPTDRVES